MDIDRNPFLAPLRFFRLPFRKQFLYISGALFAVWIMLAAPAGWIYDLWLQAGTRQGQRPDRSVQILHTQQEAEDFFFDGTPVTVSKKDLTQCPLMRLRDPKYAGNFVETGGAENSFSEYIPLNYPLRFADKVGPWLLNAFYNTYYLAPLKDGTYICVYFDDYLLLRSRQELHTGYVRASTPEETMMLRTIANDYAVQPTYVLDMYRYGKCHWILEFLVRLSIVILVPVGISSLLKRRKGEVHKQQKKKESKAVQKEEPFALKENEIVVGRAMIYNMHWSMNGTIYVTNQRVCFLGNISGAVYMELSLSEIAGYETGTVVLTESLTIHDIYDGKHSRYRYTGLAVPKLQNWLEQVGIVEL